MEARQDEQAKQIGSLAATIDRVEENQRHAEELNKLRFAALDTSVSTLTADLKGFMSRIESLITGETQTTQQRQLFEEHNRWRASVEERLEESGELSTQVRLLGRVAVFVTGGSLIGVLAAVVALYRALTAP